MTEKPTENWGLNLRLFLIVVVTVHFHKNEAFVTDVEQKENKRKDNFETVRFLLTICYAIPYHKIVDRKDVVKNCRSS